MTSGQSSRQSSTDNWPTFELTYAFNPDAVGHSARFEPDEVVVFDPAESGPAGRWVSAKRNAYLPIEELR